MIQEWAYSACAAWWGGEGVGGGVGFHQKSVGVRVIIVAKRCEKRHGVFTLIRSARGNRKFFLLF